MGTEDFPREHKGSYPLNARHRCVGTARGIWLELELGHLCKEHEYQREY